MNSSVHPDCNELVVASLRALEGGLLLKRLRLRLYDVVRAGRRLVGVAGTDSQGVAVGSLVAGHLVRNGVRGGEASVILECVAAPVVGEGRVLVLTRCELAWLTMTKNVLDLARPSR